MVFCFQYCCDLLWEKIDMAIDIFFFEIRWWIPIICKNETEYFFNLFLEVSQIWCKTLSSNGQKCRNGILFPILLWPIVRKNWYGDWYIFFEIRWWIPIIWKNESECFFNLFMEVSQIWYSRTIRIQIGKKYWHFEICRKILKSVNFGYGVSFVVSQNESNLPFKKV